jgi:succinoglycan biosynthesis transport protein ExoP
MAEDNNNGEEKNRALDRPREFQSAFTPSPPTYYYPSQEEPHLRDYLNIILRRKWVVITFFIALVTTVTIFTYMQKPLYKATATIKIDKESLNNIIMGNIVAYDWTENEAYYQTQYKILKSRNLAKRVIRSLNLNNNPEFVSNPKTKGAAVKTDNILEPIRPLKDDGIDAGLVDAFSGGVEVTPVEKSKLVNVSFTSLNPEFAAKVANAVVESFIMLQMESKIEATSQAKELLQQQLEVMKAKVEQAEEKLNEYAAKNEIIFLSEMQGEQGKSTDADNVITKKLSELSSLLTEATSDRINKETIYKAAMSGDPDSNTVVMNNPLISELKKDYATLDVDYNQQLKMYKPGYPKMVRLMEQISQLKKKIDIETKKVITSIKRDYEVALKRESSLNAAFEAQKREALNLKERSIQYLILKREADTNKELYNGLLQRLKETGVSANLTASNIQLLDRAEVPRSPFKPRRAFNIMLSMIVGLFGGVGLAFFREYLDNTIKTPEDIDKRVYLPSLGIVPHYYLNKDKFPEGYIANGGSRSPVAEAYNTIRTFLQLSTGGTPPRIITVTSPEREEGKTTTAINTAISFTRSDVKVVLIDADMRRPKLHKVFRFDNSVGLSTYLSGNVEFNESIIKTTEIPYLDIITSGPVAPNPAELLSSSKFGELMQNLSDIYSFIIVDTPPVIGISDALIVGKQTDGVILVIRSGRTPREAAQETKRMLENVNAKILGVVLNSITQGDMRHSYYSNYYRYYYGEKDK